jgi:predicted permease
LYENSLGFYITARGNHSTKESLKRVIKLPTIYAFIIGVLVNLIGIKFGQGYLDFANLFRGAYSVLGMMLIGMGLASISYYKFDFKFIGATFLTKFVVWPIIIALIIFADSTSVHLFSTEIYKIMTLVAIVPLAANTVAFATELNAHPEKSSMAVLISTIVALFYIPIVVRLFLS